jgi:hypothetical protein
MGKCGRVCRFFFFAVADAGVGFCLLQSRSFLKAGGSPSLMLIAVL